MTGALRRVLVDALSAYDHVTRSLTNSSSACALHEEIIN